MRLIDADALVFKNCNGNIEYNRGVEDCVDMVMSAQTVQAVPLSEYQELEDRFKKVCVALIAIMNEECCSYGFEEASDIAENYLAQTD